VIKALKRRGYEVLDIKMKDLKLQDTDIIRIAQRQGRVILTKDKDFISLAQFPKYQVATIVIRLKTQTPQYMLDHLIELLENQTVDVLNNSLTIIREDSAKSYPFK
jgi:predicted nuclease of predicted toxin-antitoxin system